MKYILLLMIKTPPNLVVNSENIDTSVLTPLLNKQQQTSFVVTTG